MVKGIMCFVFVFIFCANAAVLAETVGSPAGPGLPKGPGIITRDELIEKGLKPIYITGLTEFVFKKELDSSNTSNLELKGQWFLSKVYLALNDRFQPFALLGVSALDISGDYGTTKIKSSGSGNFAYGGGFSWFIAEIPDYEVSLAVSGFFRESKLDGVMRDPTRDVSNLKTKIDEVELALIAYKDITLWKIPMRPYASVFYSDSDVNFKFNTNSGTVIYDMGSVDNHRNIGLALGCEKEPLKGLALGAEVRFFTELGATAGFTLKF